MSYGKKLSQIMIHGHMTQGMVKHTCGYAPDLMAGVCP